MAHILSLIIILQVSLTNGFLCIQGLWRIPSQEVDRAGSFAAHLSQALLLLLNVLKATHDAKMLFFVHRQLAFSPPNDRYLVSVCCEVKW